MYPKHAPAHTISDTDRASDLNLWFVLCPELSENMHLFFPGLPEFMQWSFVLFSGCVEPVIATTDNIWINGQYLD